MLQLRAGAVARGSHPLESAPGLEIPSVMIALNEPPSSTARWRIRVEVKTETTRVPLGTVLTIAPASGAPPNRIVALATVPGAIAWMVECSLEPGTGDAESRATLEMASSMCCGTLGLVAPNADVITPGSIIVVTPGFVLGRRVHLAASALPGAGAFTAQAFTPVPIATKRITYWVTYARGAAGGFPAFRAQWTNGTELANEAVEDLASLAIAQPFGSVNVLQQEILGPAPADDSGLTYPLVFEVPDASIGVRLLAAERGAPGTPGTIAIALTGSG